MLSSLLPVLLLLLMAASPSMLLLHTGAEGVQLPCVYSGPTINTAHYSSSDPHIHFGNCYEGTVGSNFGVDFAGIYDLYATGVTDGSITDKNATIVIENFKLNSGLIQVTMRDTAGASILPATGLRMSIEIRNITIPTQGNIVFRKSLPPGCFVTITDCNLNPQASYAIYTYTVVLAQYTSFSIVNNRFSTSANCGSNHVVSGEFVLSDQSLLLFSNNSIASPCFILGVFYSVLNFASGGTFILSDNVFEADANKTRLLSLHPVSVFTQGTVQVVRNRCHGPLVGVTNVGSIALTIGSLFGLLVSDNVITIGGPSEYWFNPTTHTVVICDLQAPTSSLRLSGTITVSRNIIRASTAGSICVSSNIASPSSWVEVQLLSMDNKWVIDGVNAAITIIYNDVQLPLCAPHVTTLSPVVFLSSLFETGVFNVTAAPPTLFTISHNSVVATVLPPTATATAKRGLVEVHVIMGEVGLSSIPRIILLTNYFTLETSQMETPYTPTATLLCTTPTALWTSGPLRVTCTNNIIQHVTTWDFRCHNTLPLTTGAYFNLSNYVAVPVGSPYEFPYSSEEVSLLDNTFNLTGFRGPWLQVSMFKEDVVASGDTTSSRSLIVKRNVVDIVSPGELEDTPSFLTPMGVLDVTIATPQSSPMSGTNPTFSTQISENTFVLSSALLYTLLPLRGSVGTARLDAVDVFLSIYGNTMLTGDDTYLAASINTKAALSNPSSVDVYQCGNRLQLSGGAVFTYDTSSWVENDAGQTVDVLSCPCAIPSVLPISGDSSTSYSYTGCSLPRLSDSGFKEGGDVMIGMDLLLDQVPASSSIPVSIALDSIPTSTSGTIHIHGLSDPLSNKVISGSFSFLLKNSHFSRTVTSSQSPDAVWYLGTAPPPALQIHGLLPVNSNITVMGCNFSWVESISQAGGMGTLGGGGYSFIALQSTVLQGSTSTMILSNNSMVAEYEVQQILDSSNSPVTSDASHRTVVLLSLKNATLSDSSSLLLTHCTMSQNVVITWLVQYVSVCPSSSFNIGRTIVPRMGFMLIGEYNNDGTLTWMDSDPRADNNTLTLTNSSSVALSDLFSLSTISWASNAYYVKDRHVVPVLNIVEGGTLAVESGASFTIQSTTVLYYNTPPWLSNPLSSVCTGTSNDPVYQASNPTNPYRAQLYVSAVLALQNLKAINEASVAIDTVGLSHLSQALILGASSSVLLHTVVRVIAIGSVYLLNTSTVTVRAVTSMVTGRFSVLTASVYISVQVMSTVTITDCDNTDTPSATSTISHDNEVMGISTMQIDSGSTIALMRNINSFHGALGYTTFNLLYMTTTGWNENGSALVISDNRASGLVSKYKVVFASGTIQCITAPTTTNIFISIVVRNNKFDMSVIDASSSAACDATTIDADIAASLALQPTSISSNTDTFIRLRSLLGCVSPGGVIGGTQVTISDNSVTERGMSCSRRIGGLLYVQLLGEGPSGNSYAGVSHVVITNNTMIATDGSVVADSFIIIITPVIVSSTDYTSPIFVVSNNTISVVGAAVPSMVHIAVDTYPINQQVTFPLGSQEGRVHLLKMTDNTATISQRSTVWTSSLFGMSDTLPFQTVVPLTKPTLDVTVRGNTIFSTTAALNSTPSAVLGRSYGSMPGKCFGPTLVSIIRVCDTWLNDTYGSDASVMPLINASTFEADVSQVCTISTTMSQSTALSKSMGTTTLSMPTSSSHTPTLYKHNTPTITLPPLHTPTKTSATPTLAGTPTASIHPTPTVSPLPLVYSPTVTPSHTKTVPIPIVPIDWSPCTAINNTRVAGAVTNVMTEGGSSEGCMPVFRVPHTVWGGGNSFDVEFNIRVVRGAGSVRINTTNFTGLSVSGSSDVRVSYSGRGQEQMSTLHGATVVVVPVRLSVRFTGQKKLGALGRIVMDASGVIGWTDNGFGMYYKRAVTTTTTTTAPPPPASTTTTPPPTTTISMPPTTTTATTTTPPTTSTPTTSTTTIPTSVTTASASTIAPTTTMTTTTPTTTDGSIVVLPASLNTETFPAKPITTTSAHRGFAAMTDDTPTMSFAMELDASEVSEFTKVTQTVSEAVVGGGGALTANPSGVVRAGMISAIANMLRCGEVDLEEPLPWMNNVFLLKFGADEGAYHRGSLVSGLIVVCIGLALCGIVIVATHLGMNVGWVGAAAGIHFPGVMVASVSLAMEGWLPSSVTLLSKPNAVGGDIAWGVVFLLVSIAYCLHVLYTAGYNLGVETVDVVDDDAEERAKRGTFRRVADYLLEPTMEIRPRAQRVVEGRWWIDLYHPYGSDMRFIPYKGLELALGGVVNITEGFVAEQFGGCVAKVSIALLSVACVGVLIIVYRPFATRVGAVMGVLVTFLMFVACAMGLANLWLVRDDLSEAADGMLSAAALAVTLQMLSEILGIVLGARKSLEVFAKKMRERAARGLWVARARAGTTRLKSISEVEHNDHDDSGHGDVHDDVSKSAPLLDNTTQDPYPEATPRGVPDITHHPTTTTTTYMRDLALDDDGDTTEMEDVGLYPRGDAEEGSYYDDAEEGEYNSEEDDDDEETLSPAQLKLLRELGQIRSAMANHDSSSDLGEYDYDDESSDDILLPPPSSPLPPTPPATVPNPHRIVWSHRR